MTEKEVKDALRTLLERNQIVARIGPVGEVRYFGVARDLGPSFGQRVDADGKPVDERKG